MTAMVRTGVVGGIFLMGTMLGAPPVNSEAEDAFLKKDYATAYRIWKPLADRGDVSASFNLGVLYERGLGVRRDLSEAFRLFHVAGDEGLAQAQVELGRMYARGWGTAQRFGEAFQWFEKAAEQGDPDGQRSMGWLYDQGYGVPRDYKAAAKWYQLAADQGDAEGQYRLARLYLEGNGVRKDPVQAYCLLTRASATNKKAVDEVAALNRKLSTEQVAEGLKCSKSPAGEHH